MSKIQKTTRVYLTIEVEEPWRPTKTWTWASNGRTKMDEVKRLLNASNLDGLSNVDYHVESSTVCTLCGLDWEEDEDGPLCCNAAQEEWKAEIAAKQAAS